MSKVQKKLQNYLVLNKYLCSLFGFKDIEDFRRLLRSVNEGINEHDRHYFNEALQTLKISEEFRQNLNQYDENIQEYLKTINQKRDPPIVLKYFQYISLLFTEIYLDKYFNEEDAFYNQLIYFVKDMNTKEGKIGIQTYPYPNKNSLRKIAFWSATGSGKTLIMHINYLQILKYNTAKYENILLITPNEGLTKQHIDELNLSSIQNKRFEVQKTLEDWSLSNPIKVIEITKIKEEVSSMDGATVPVEAFGGNNIIFVDEGHKGHSTDAKRWKTNRKNLVKNGGFTFEYSATFGEITDKDDTFNQYASSIIFDYRYKYFYEDGYGKDYQILNLKNKEDYDDEYFTGSLLSLYEQKIYFKNYARQIKPFRLENPLMIFVGSSVSGGLRETDVMRVVKFISRFVNDNKTFKKQVENILNNKSSLVDEMNNPIFDTKFPYLRELIRNKTKLVTEVYDELIKNLFHVKTSKTIQFIEIKNADGEIGLKFDHEYFGVINIGDVSSFLKLVEKSGSFQVAPASNFEKSLFERIQDKSSTINFLIGSKKFTEGWNCYRVSSMGLLNMGKSEGTQIIQLFGRGVRLYGYNNWLKRSSSLDNEGALPDEIIIPTFLNILETLNIYGLNADYMATFRETLKEEGIEEYERIVLKIKPTVPNRALYVPRISEKKATFKEEVFITSFSYEVAPIKLDLSSKIDILESDKGKLRYVHTDTPIQENLFDEEILSLIDFDKVYLEIMKYKDLKDYGNLYFTKNDLINLLSKKKYQILCKKDILKLSSDDSFTKIEKIESYIVQVLKLLLDKSYNGEKYSWYQKNLSYEIVSDSDDKLIPREYVFTINSNDKSFIDNIRDFTNKLREFIRVKSDLSEEIYEKNLNFSYKENKVIEFFSLNIHLFKPLLYKNKNLEFIKISPVNLVESERQFIKQIEDYIDKEEIPFDKIYLLRNPSRKGVGFFETVNFYPDFILWVIYGDKQAISFIDPHGLGMTSRDDEKLKLYEKIKEIQNELNKKTGLNIFLNSFILSPTNYKDLTWKEAKEKLNTQNILFLEDGKHFVGQILNKVSADMK